MLRWLLQSNTVNLVKLAIWLHTHPTRVAAHLPCLAEVTRAAARVIAPWFGIGIACHLAIVPPQLIQIVVPDWKKRYLVIKVESL